MIRMFHVLHSDVQMRVVEASWSSEISDRGSQTMVEGQKKYKVGSLAELVFATGFTACFQDQIVLIV